MKRGILLLLFAAALIASGAQGEPNQSADNQSADNQSADNQSADNQSANSWRWTLPEFLPPPRVPADNAMSEARFQLGRKLFYDARLSGNGKERLCASCHEQRLAFTDGRPAGVGATGRHYAAQFSQRRQRRLARHADLGQSGDGDARKADGRAAVWRRAHRDGRQ